MRQNNLLQAFLDFRSFDFSNFWFSAVYNSILFSSPLVLLSNLDLGGFLELVDTNPMVFATAVFFMCPHINSVNQGMPVIPELNTINICMTYVNSKIGPCSWKTNILLDHSSNRQAYALVFDHLATTKCF